jgi:glutamate-1-semialdehyde 2,1-aminomutase
MNLNIIRETLHAEFLDRFPTSAQRYAEAKEIFPAGVTHDGRYLNPFPVYVNRAQGSHKWDVDGHQFVDFWMGHGALLLGHNYPQITQAVTEQVSQGTHYGASHELEISWGRWVQRLIPSAERVRFVSSGTEATMMAIRLARGFTGRNKLVRFATHFHGWHDTAMLGVSPPFDTPDSVGIPGGTLAAIKVLPPNDIAAVEQTLSSDPDIAAVILEPAGGHNGAVPTRPGYLAALRELCAAHRVILIFDEVVTGFRYSPGGAQAYFGVTPDMTTLAKILGGGLPGGAVAGRADIMAQIDFTNDPKANRTRRLSHPGTFNANPLSAAAGIAMLEIAASGEPQQRSYELTRQLAQGLNEVLQDTGTPGCVYYDRSGFHILAGQKDFQPENVEEQIAQAQPERLVAGMGPLTQPFRAAMLLQGIDLSGSAGRLSAVHSEGDIEQTLSAFARTLDRFRRWQAW